MAYFVFEGIDRPGVLAERQSLRPPHRERLRVHDHPVTVHVGGPLLDDAGDMIGSLLIIEAADRATVEHYLAGDPYMQAGIFASTAIRPFAWGLGAPEPRNG
jgi:uncharacterized protein YciI